MARLAIRGHETRGQEVIEILKMLGAKEKHLFSGDGPGYYYIDGDNNISYILECDLHPSIKHYSLADFFEKFPYKVGDKVAYKKSGKMEVVRMYWDDKFDIVRYDAQAMTETFVVRALMPDNLKPFKEENIKCKEKEMSGAIIDRFICLEGYDFYDDKGNVIDTKEITMKKKKPQYPKSYEECCKVLNLNNNLLLTYNDFTLETPYDDNLLNLLGIFRKLKICRDAYWKIAGEEMGLGKSWEPDWNTNELKYIIYYENDKLWFNDEISRNTILAFPTEEIRDDFFGNFYKEIEECKEFL